MSKEFAAVCPGCFRHKGGDIAICPHCRYDATVPRSPLLLPVLTHLHKRYLIGKPLGRPGGFGVTYLSFDLTLRVLVAVKEYCPRDLVARGTTDPVSLVAHSPDDAESFQIGLQAFLDEARTLARFSHSNVVRVRDFFEANNTAYIVMDYYEGEVLIEHLVRHGGKLPWRAALTLLLPIIDALREVHTQGFLHRDVKPQNIYLTQQGKPILLDFGAARQVMGERSRSLSIMLTEGYAPFEQYHSRGQGPWTDIYGVAATLYLLITGQTPPAATERTIADTLIPPQTLAPEISPLLNTFILNALAVDPEKRTQTAEILHKRLVAALSGFSGFDATSANPPSTETTQYKTKMNPTVTQMIPPSYSDSSNRSVYKLVVFCTVLMFISALGYFSIKSPTKNAISTGTYAEGTSGHWLVKGQQYYTKGEYKQAVFWIEKAAEDGNAEAQFRLALIYNKGEGVEKNDADAEMWLKKAADQGHADAQQRLKSPPFAKLPEKKAPEKRVHKEADKDKAEPPDQ